MNLVLKRSITQFSQSAEKELTGQGMQRLSFIEADENTPTKRRVPKILKLIELISENATIEDPVGKLPQEGKAALGAFFLLLVATLPQTNLGTAALPLSVIGLANQCLLA